MPDSCCKTVVARCGQRVHPSNIYKVEVSTPSHMGRRGSKPASEAWIQGRLGRWVGAGGFPAGDHTFSLVSGQQWTFKGTKPGDGSCSKEILGQRGTAPVLSCGHWNGWTRPRVDAAPWAALPPHPGVCDLPLSLTGRLHHQAGAVPG